MTADPKACRRKALIRTKIVFFLAPVGASIGLILGVLHITTYAGPDLRQFDPETEMELRIFGAAVLGLVGAYLATRWIVASPNKKPVSRGHQKP